MVLFPKKMMYRIVGLFLSVVLSTTMLCAQTRLTLKGALMFAPVELHQGQNTLPTDALIDTGSSFSVVDSTFAVDHLHVDPQTLQPQKVRGVVELVDMHRTTIDSLHFGGETYRAVPCVVADMRRRFQQHAPMFIIGADVLKRALWKFDLSALTIEKMGHAKPKGTALKWKSHRDLSYATLFSIYFLVKINGQKHYLMFDTGGRTNHLPPHLGLQADGKIEKETASIESTLKMQEFDLYKSVPFEIGGQKFMLDFLSARGKEGCLNIEFLKGKSFVLHYKKKRLILLDE